MNKIFYALWKKEHLHQCEKIKALFFLFWESVTYGSITSYIHCCYFTTLCIITFYYISLHMITYDNNTQYVIHW